MARRGRDLETLVQAIERATDDAADITVESPKRLRDKDTGRMREHDVVLTLRQAHHEVLIAAECRDRSSRVGVPAVEGFHSKCQRTGIHQGIIVSSSGFTSTALAKAMAYGIRCLSIEQAVAFDWCQAPGIVVRQREVQSVRVQFEPENNAVAGTVLFDRDGKRVDQQMLRNIASNCLRQLGPELDEPVDKSIRRVFVDSNPQFVIGNDHGPQQKAQSITIEIVYVVYEKLLPMEFHIYRDESEGSTLYSVASGRVEAGALRGRLVALQESDGTVRVAWMPDGAQSAPSAPSTPGSAGPETAAPREASAATAGSKAQNPTKRRGRR